jgi:excisionase family DNA binding protein
MHEEWMTLSQAAKHLGLAPRTIRRWIHDGKLQAELRPGPYGQQYLVPTRHLQAIQVTRDVERADRQADLAALTQLLEEYLGRRESALTVELAELRGAVERLRDEQQALRREVGALRRALARRLPSDGD